MKVAVIRPDDGLLLDFEDIDVAPFVAQFPRTAGPVEIQPPELPEIPEEDGDPTNPEHAEFIKTKEELQARTKALLEEHESRRKLLQAQADAAAALKADADGLAAAIAALSPDRIHVPDDCDLVPHRYRWGDWQGHKAFLPVDPHAGNDPDPDAIRAIWAGFRELQRAGLVKFPAVTADWIAAYGKGVDALDNFDQGPYRPVKN